MRTIIILIGLLFIISGSGKAQDSKPVFEKKIYSPLDKEKYIQMYYYTTKRPVVTVNVQAKDSSNFNVIFTGRVHDECDRKYGERDEELNIFISNRNLNAFTTCMKKYIDWMAIATSENIKLTKQIAVFNSYEFSALRVTPGSYYNVETNTMDSKKTNNNYTKLIIGVEDNYFVLTAYGTRTQEMYNNITYQKYYNTIDVSMTIVLSQSEVQDIYPMISGDGLKSLKIEIAKKVSVWNQFK